MAYEENLAAMKLDYRKCFSPDEAIFALLMDDADLKAAIKSKIQAVQAYNIAVEDEFNAMTEEQKLEKIRTYSNPVIDAAFIAQYGA